MWLWSRRGFAEIRQRSRLRAAFGGARSRSPDGSSAVWTRKHQLCGVEGYACHGGVVGLVLRDGDEIATAESLRRERDMIDRVNHGIGRCDRLGGVEKFIASDRLRPEQKRVVEFVLDSRDRVVAISGAAGTGKTATLQELRARPVGSTRRGSGCRTNYERRRGVAESRVRGRDYRGTTPAGPRRAAGAP